MNKTTSATYDVVENAIDLSKEIRGTWEELLRRKTVKPWGKSELPKSTEHPDKSDPKADES
jgi:hypothetical protein